MRPKRIAILIIVSLLLAAAAAAGLLLLVDPSIFRGQIESGASAAFGRPFRIGGEIKLERSLRPQIILRDITIDNPDWAAGAYFARAGHVAVRVALLAMLRGKLQVMDVTFEDMEIFIENGPEAEGMDNYTFAESGDRATTRWLPSIEHMVIKNTVVHYHPTTGGQRRFEIVAAQLWNAPGEPERIAVEGMLQDIQFNLAFKAEPDAKLSGPDHPWSIHLDVQSADLVATIEGRMPRAFAWQQFAGRIAFHGEQAKHLALLLDIDLPSTGPFDISAAMHTADDAITLNSLKGRIKGFSGLHDIELAGGEFIIDRNALLKLELQALIADMPLALQLETNPPSPPATEDTPRPVTAALQIADVELDLQGTMTAVDGQPHLAFEGQLQGQNFDNLTKLLGRELPGAGAYQFTFKSEMMGDRLQLDNLNGEIAATPHWDTIAISRSGMRMMPDGSIDATIEARLDGVPLSLSFIGHPKKRDEAERALTPFELKTTLPGTELTAQGMILDNGEDSQLKITAHLRGDRLNTLGALVGITLPSVGPYVLATDFQSGGGINKLQNIHAKLGADRVTGQLQWQDKAPRPLLTGRLLTEHLTVKTFSSHAMPPAKDTPAPVDIGWLKAFDARLDISINQVTDLPLPIKTIDASATITDGRLTVPFHALVGGVACNGRLDLDQQGKMPRIVLKAETGKIDAGQFVKQMDLPGTLHGTIGAVRLDGHSRGRTLRALLARAVLNVKLDTADLQYNGQFAGRPLDLAVTAGELKTEGEGPLQASFVGTFQRLPFDAQASTASLNELLTRETHLPIRLDMKTAYAVFTGRGTVARPLTRGVFDLEHEISGDEIEGLDPLIDLALPLQGAFSARGTITGRGGHMTYVEDLQVGKSDFQLTMDFWQLSPRPQVKAAITSKTIYLNNIKLLPGNDPSRQAPKRRYLIPEYMLPVDYLRTIDLDIDIQTRRVLSDIGDLGSLTSQITIKDGRFVSTTTIAKPNGGRARKRVEVDATVEPPMNKLEIDAHAIDYTFLRELNPGTIIKEGALDFHLHLFGPGTTRKKILAHADGTATLIGGPGRLRERRIELWAADLIPTLLSPQWRSEETAELNCMVARIGVADGLATIDEMLLDTSRVTIAGSGVVNLKSEELDLFLAPRPKQASLVSLANPVNISGTMSQPEISVAPLPGRSRSRLARTGILAGLINPLFLLTLLSDTGTIGDTHCTAAIERAHEAMGQDLP
jgi:uncharacterized protein involved in outer membrane biogenesis